ncbi:MAG TPA: DUF389 domain-containing protein [Saprospiraceae bacterium]|nr:DUF389 domain-containing protein [Saprospiraceae bacterium]HQW55904.1 DUF389 domain-containing protein [Saprospiraceae bacterium]
MSNYLKSLFNLRNGEEDKMKVLANIRSNIAFRGPNLWILMCAILVASVGLNINSTAVIIGAMLISPLMGPIVGAGFALGMYDFTLLRRSLTHLLVATVVGLSVSFIYFWLTPFKDPLSELISRTSPNFYDVMIAFFGGLVGVIAVTRMEKGNPIPGVAIATALMPPLCTAGYGLAVGNWTYFGGAMFLYTINSTFICIATFIIVKYLHYPAAKQLDERQTRRLHWVMTAITMALIVPSIYFAYHFYQEQQFKKSVQDFVTREFDNKGNTVIFQKTNYQTSPRLIELAFLSRKFTTQEITKLNSSLDSCNLKNTRLIIRQDSAFLAEKKIKPDLENNNENKEKLIIAQLSAELQSYRLSKDNIFPEANSIFPSIRSISVVNQHVYNASDTVNTTPTAFYSADKPLSKSDFSRLQRWLMVKLKVDTIEVYKRN